MKLIAIVTAKRKRRIIPTSYCFGNETVTKVRSFVKNNGRDFSRPFADEIDFVMKSQYSVLVETAVALALHYNLNTTTPCR
jgi:hypothetical protein